MISDTPKLDTELKAELVQFVVTGDEVAEWLRRWTANPMCSARVGSNPILVVIFLVRALHTRTILPN